MSYNASQIYLKKGDTGPRFEAQLRDRNSVVNISQSQPYLYVKNRRTNEIVIDERPLEIEDAENGEVSVEWETSDTVEAGDLVAEVVVEWSDEEITFPNRGFIPVKISEDIKSKTTED